MESIKTTLLNDIYISQEKISHETGLSAPYLWSASEYSSQTSDKSIVQPAPMKKWKYNKAFVNRSSVGQQEGVKAHSLNSDNKIVQSILREPNFDSQNRTGAICFSKVECPEQWIRFSSAKLGRVQNLQSLFLGSQSVYYSRFPLVDVPSVYGWNQNSSIIFNQIRFRIFI
jgi:hypothetical protein